jgi:hypothetical protein
VNLRRRSSNFFFAGAATAPHRCASASAASSSCRRAAACSSPLALVVMLLGAINYNLALGHALVFLLAGLGVVGMIHTFRNLFGLVITPGRCEPVFAGETAHFSAGPRQ